MNKYIILEHIDTGGDAAVFKAFDSVNDRYVVLKRYCRSEDTIVPTAMLREVSVLGKLKGKQGKQGGCHYIIKLFEVTSDANYFYLVLEFSGETILDAIRNGEVQSVSEKQKITVELVECINYLHSIGYVHGDINLKNVLFNNHSRSIKLIDFCSAIRFHRKDIVYRPMIYVCPYELVNNKPVNLKSLDIWMLGCVCYFVVTGNPLFLSWDQDTHIKSIDDMLDVSKPFDAIKGSSNNYIKKMLSINPFKRGTIKEVVKANGDVYKKFGIVPCDATAVEDVVGHMVGINSG
ncbi:MAG: serine/threonine protein kinase, partial [Harvfovirus sp.]